MEGMAALARIDFLYIWCQSHTRPFNFQRRLHMLMTLAIILVVLWLLGMVSAYTMGGLIHVLLVVAVIVILVRVIQGRRVV